MLLESCSNAMGRALREGRDTYAASTYAICDALFAAYKTQAEDKAGRLPPGCTVKGLQPRPCRVASK